jgi:hypothetical protein
LRATGGVEVQGQVMEGGNKLSSVEYRMIKVQKVNEIKFVLIEFKQKLGLFTYRIMINIDNNRREIILFNVPLREIFWGQKHGILIGFINFSEVLNQLSGIATDTGGRTSVHAGIEGDTVWFICHSATLA